MRTRLMLLSLCLSPFFLIAGASSAAERLPTQSTSGSGVTVKATPRALAGGSWEFDIVFDTHTQDLKDDLMKTASLMAAGKAHAASGWKGDPPGGHHRKGVLRFDGIDPGLKDMELRIARPGEPKPRSFRWQLK
jgi:hypothetical protein